MWATWRGPPDPAGLSKGCGQVPQQLSTGWHLPAPSPAQRGATIVMTSSPMCMLSSRRGHLRQQVDQSDGLVAGRTWSSGPYTPAKPLALVASLFAQEPRLALRALVDDAGTRYAAWQWRQGGSRMPLAPGGLTVRVIAKALPTVWNEAGSTKPTLADNRLAAIVTRRGVRHCRSPCAGAVPACV
jgi:hypothetical protein